MPSETIPRIAIIGAGLGGLTLASVMEHRKMPVNLSVFEADYADGRADQGGTLDLKLESGQKALRAAGLHDRFLKICRPEGADLRLLDKSGIIHFEVVGTTPKAEAEAYNPEIDRAELRQLLLDSISPKTIYWNHKLVGLLTNDTCPPTYTLEFADPGQAKVTVDVVVGADGAWSRVRAMSSVPALPLYTGITFVDIALVGYERKYPNISNLVGQGSMFALGDSKALIAQRNSRNVIRVYAALKVEETWQKDSDVCHVSDTSSRVDLLTSKDEYFAGWNEELLDVIRGSRTCTSVIRPIYALPLSYLQEEQKNDTQIVLLGDAAHLMSPFAGEGVNLAMADALDMADALTAISSGSEVDDALRTYEKEMRERALKAGTESAKNLEMYFKEDDAVKRVKEMFVWWKTSAGEL